MNEKKLYVVVDMQNDFIGGALGSKEAQAIVPLLAERVKEYPNVIYTLDTHGEDYLSTQEGRKLPVAHCILGTDGHKLVKELEELSAGKLKVTKGAFGSVELAQKIKRDFDGGLIQEVVLAGVCTDICVVSNAMLIKAFCPEIPIAVDADCCAGTTPENHQKALDVMGICHVEIREIR
ncbi:MAG: cysteine hydrolase [Clostridiales bacterium]|nr:cysteine hydrolase [Clostridiales bacterium]